MPVLPPAGCSEYIHGHTPIKWPFSSLIRARQEKILARHSASVFSTCSQARRVDSRWIQTIEKYSTVVLVPWMGLELVRFSEDTWSKIKVAHVCPAACPLLTAVGYNRWKASTKANLRSGWQEIGTPWTPLYTTFTTPFDMSRSLGVRHNTYVMLFRAIFWEAVQPIELFTARSINTEKSTSRHVRCARVFSHLLVGYIRNDSSRPCPCMEPSATVQLPLRTIVGMLRRASVVVLGLILKTVLWVCSL